MLFKSIVPPEITDLEFNFMKKINPFIEKQGDNTIGYSYVSISPEAINFNVGYCQSNVARKIHESGGNFLAGWCIWKSPVLLEAEYHHLWISPEGEIKDITPQRDDGKYILFVADPNQNYDGYPIQNKRKILIDIPEVHEMIELQDKIYKIKRKYWLPFEDKFTIPVTEFGKMQTLENKLNSVLFKIEDFLENS